MELVTSLPADTPLRQVAQHVRRIENLGFDTVHISETIRDPFAVAALAVEHSSTLTVRTSMVVAFARSPMVTALAAWDLAGFSGGRFNWACDAGAWEHRRAVLDAVDGSCCATA